MTTAAPPSDLASRVAAYRGNPHKLLLRLLENPDAFITTILAEIGCAIGSYNRWCSELPDFKETRDAIRANRQDLRKVAAQAIMESRMIPIVQAMAARAEGDGRDAQRAAERILEEVGVLHRALDVGSNGLDILAIRIRSTLASPADAIPSPTDRLQLISGHTADDESPSSDPSPESQIQNDAT